MKTVKFGGSSLASAEQIRKVCDIITADPARRLEAAIAAVYADGRALTPDQGGSGTTASFVDAVRSSL